MEKIKLEYTHGDSIARITLNSPKGNVLDSIMMKELTGVLTSFKNNNAIKAITFEGAGDHFSFGASVEEHKREFAARMLRDFHNIFYTLADLSIPAIAKISGQCLGGALELCLMCNIIFADKTASLGQPEIMLGVFPPPASILLPMKIGSARAEELLISGKSISAEKAHSLGLVNEVFDDKNAMNSSVDEYIAKNIVPKSASSLRYAVRASRVFTYHILHKFLPALEEMYVNKLMNTNDANEGINSFLEKRKPVWQNK
jgi:cyclohexa-1,5-dienecarbonyl-CoA hydratase